MLRSPCLAILMGCFALLGACLKEDFQNDGAFCSDENTCPPGQRCSPDGYCLFPCPVEDCTGNTCGCEPRVGGDWQLERVCGDDGFCHLQCETDSSGCYIGFVCDVARGECVYECDSGNVCVNGASCVTSTGVSGEIHVCRAP